MALSVAAVVCIASSNGGTIAQEPQDGLPRRRHAPLAAVAPSWSARSSSALVIGGTLLALNYGRHGVLEPEPRTFPSRAAESGTTQEAAVRETGPGRRHALPTSGTPRKATPRQSSRGSTSSTTRGSPLSGRSGHQRPTDADRRRDEKSKKVQSAPGRIVRLDYPRHSQSEAAVDLVALGRAHRGGHGAMRRRRSLAFAVGVYLPLSSTTPIFIGGLVR